MEGSAFCPLFADFFLIMCLYTVSLSIIVRLTPLFQACKKNCDGCGKGQTRKPFSKYDYLQFHSTWSQVC